MALFTSALLAAAVFAAPLPAPVPTPDCTYRARVTAPTFRLDLCLDRGMDGIEGDLKAVVDEMEATDPKDIAWCIDTAFGSSCGVVDAHPWCDPDPNTGDSCLQDVMCCILTIVNGGCGGCLDPS